MLWKSILAVCVGGSLGSLLRWWFSASLNAQFPPVPPGTLASNLVGCYIVGMLMAGRPTWALAAAGIHLFGSLLMTFAGIATFAWLRTRS